MSNGALDEKKEHLRWGKVRERNMAKICKIIDPHVFPSCFLMLETGPVLDQAPNNIFFFRVSKIFCEESKKFSAQ